MTKAFCCGIEYALAQMTGQPYTFANILNEMPKWAHRLFWTSVFALAVFALSILLILL